MEWVLSILFHYLNTNNEDETYYQIAKSIIQNMEKIRFLNLEETSESCNCSPSTIQRFCRELGFINFSHFKELINRKKHVYHFDEYSSTDFHNHIVSNLTMTYNNLDDSVLQKICCDLKSSSRVIILGFQLNNSYILDFQTKMMLSNKFIEIGPKELNKTWLDSLTKKDFLIILSAQGNYIYGNWKFLEQANKKGVSSLLLTLSKDFNSYFSKVIECGNFSFYGESSYSFMYALDLISTAYMIKNATTDFSHKK